MPGRYNHTNRDVTRMFHNLKTTVETTTGKPVKWTIEYSTERREWDLFLEPKDRFHSPFISGTTKAIFNALKLALKVQDIIEGGDESDFKTTP